MDFQNSKIDIMKTFEEKEAKYIQLLEEQNKNHVQEIILLQEQLLLTEQRLEEKLQTPLKKLMQKYFTNRK